MDVTALRQCQATLAEVDVPTPFDLERFCNGLRRTHGLRVALVPVRDHGSRPCGLRARLHGVHHVLHDHAAPVGRRDHGSLHVIAHLLLGHGPGHADDDCAIRGQPDADATMARSALGDGAYSDADEEAADALAALILREAEST